MILTSTLVSALSGASGSLALLATAAPTGAFTTAQSYMFPLVILAITIDALIVAIWYMIGALLSSQQLKAGARAEALQVVGTAIIGGLILAFLLAFGTIYYNSVQGIPGYPTVLQQGQIYTMSQQLGCPPTPNGLPVFGTATFDTVSSLLGGPFLLPTSGSAPASHAPTPCSIVATVTDSGANIGDDGTTLAEFPLASAMVINANVMNQLGQGLNDAFIIDAYLEYLNTFTPTIAICVGGLGVCSSLPFVNFLPPIPFAPSPNLYVQWAARPLYGADQFDKPIQNISGLLYNSLVIADMQLLFEDILLYSWPWLLFAGLALRGLFFTRKLGGILIAVALSAILIYPTVLGIEYLASNNPALFPSSPSTQLTFCGSNAYSYQVNYFALPSLAGVAQDCGCYPGGGSLGEVVNNNAEDMALTTTFWWGDLANNAAGLISSFASNPAGAIGGFFYGVSTSVDTEQSFANAAQGTVEFCNYGGYTGQTSPTTGLGIFSGGEGMDFSVPQIYGVDGVAGYFLPILNILITIASMLGLSGLLGGDVQLAGLSRFV